MINIYFSSPINKGLAVAGVTNFGTAKLYLSAINIIYIQTHTQVVSTTYELIYTELDDGVNDNSSNTCLMVFFQDNLH